MIFEDSILAEYVSFDESFKMPTVQVGLPSYDQEFQLDSENPELPKNPSRTSIEQPLQKEPSIEADGQQTCLSTQPSLEREDLSYLLDNKEEEKSLSPSDAQDQGYEKSFWEHCGRSSSEVIGAICTVEPKDCPDFLVQLIDTESANFILNRKLKLDDNLKEFLELSAQTMTKSTLSIDPNFSQEEWVNNINSIMKSVPKKRIDQKLRLVFSLMIKHLTETLPISFTAKTKQYQKSEKLYEYYSWKNPQKLKKDLQNCKFPSMKRLKTLFSDYPLLGRDCKKAFEDGSFQKHYQEKKTLKATYFFEQFVLNKHRGFSRPQMVEEFKIYLKSFPWSDEEIGSTCSMIAECVNH